MARAFAPLAAAAAAALLRPRSSQCDTGGELPRWLRDGVPQDPSRKAKIQAYEEAQASSEAAARNRTLPRRGSRGLRLVSFNVHFHRDCQMKPNVARILEVLEKLDADVIALQEVGIPENLGKSGRWSAADDPQPADHVSGTASLVELMSKQLFQSTEQGFAVTSKDEQDGTALLKGLKDLGYCEGVYSPAFKSGIAGFYCGNAVLSRLPLQERETVMLDRNRADENRTAAVVDLKLGEEPLTIVSTHLDVWAEMRGFFGMAEGEAIRLLEFEALHEATKARRNVIIMGDFNAPSQLQAACSPNHAEALRLVDRLSTQRDPKALRHFLPRESPRIPEEMTALGFAEKLGYRHAWQMLPVPCSPLYSHWSGQLIDHCLLRVAAKLRVSHFDVFHTDASDHLPLVMDFQLE